MLTGRPTREEYEKRYGLDHARLREGGRALLDGEGEIGSALFEASAGVRSIPGIRAPLNEQACSFYSPLGKSAIINVGINDFKAQNAALTEALVRPAQWEQLQRQHQADKEKLHELERQHHELIGTLHRITELRAVAPLLRTLDEAREQLATMENVVLLAENAVTERVSAQAGLSTTRTQAQQSEHNLAQYKAKLAPLNPDAQVLAMAQSIDRFASAVEDIDACYIERAHAEKKSPS